MWEGSESVPDGMDGMVDLLPGTKQVMHAMMACCCA